MNKGKLIRSITSLYCGAHNEELRQEVIKEIKTMTNNDLRLFMNNYLREMFIGEEATKKGYGYEDVSSFFKWLSDYMDYDI